MDINLECTRTTMTLSPKTSTTQTHPDLAVWVGIAFYKRIY